MRGEKKTKINLNFHRRLVCVIAKKRKKKAKKGNKYKEILGVYMSTYCICQQIMKKKEKIKTSFNLNQSQGG